MNFNYNLHFVPKILLVFTISCIQSLLSIVNNILISICNSDISFLSICFRFRLFGFIFVMLGLFCFDHFFELWFECSIESFCINNTLILSKDFGDAEFDVWNCILAGHDEGWDNIFFYRSRIKIWHNSSHGFKATNSTIGSYICLLIFLSDIWKIVRLYPTCSKFLS